MDEVTERLSASNAASLLRAAVNGAVMDNSRTRLERYSIPYEVQDVYGASFNI